MRRNLGDAEALAEVRRVVDDFARRRVVEEVRVVVLDCLLVVRCWLVDFVRCTFGGTLSAAAESAPAPSPNTVSAKAKTQDNLIQKSLQCGYRAMRLPIGAALLAQDLTSYPTRSGSGM